MNEMETNYSGYTIQISSDPSAYGSNYGLIITLEEAEIITARLEGEE